MFTELTQSQFVKIKLFLVYSMFYAVFNTKMKFILVFLGLTDPPGGKTVDQTSVDEFRDLLNLNLVNYFIFCKVSICCSGLHQMSLY